MTLKIDSLLANTGKLFESIRIFKLSKSSLKPTKDHYASHIHLLDFKFNKDHFLTRLRESIIAWVYTKNRAKAIFDEEFGSDEDYSSAAAKLYQSAKETFRINAPQGQFGELLLSAFLQHIFKAAPLLRKQVVRTSDNHERFGADAIHYSNSNGEHIYIGESKCYTSKYQFPAAFKSSISSMCNTIESFATEIKKFTAGGFIQEELKSVARDLLSNKIEGLTIHPVSILIYNETAGLQGKCAADYHLAIEAAIKNQCKKIDEAAYGGMNEDILSRFVYIVMPVWKLDELLEEFAETL